MSKIPESPALSDRDLIRALASYLQAQAPSSQAAAVLHQQLGPKLARIIAGEAPNTVLHIAARGRPVPEATQVFQSAVAGYLAWRRSEDSTKKAAVGEAARLLKISDSDVNNASRAAHTIQFEGRAFAVLAEMSGTTPERILQSAYSAHVNNLKKKPRKKPRGK